MNFRVPKTLFRFPVSSEDDRVIVVLTKINPEEAWGNFEIEYDIEVLK